MTNETKLIRVLDRKVIPTSRGTCRGPIGPYRENLNRILVLISRGYNVVEVLPDKSEVKLTEINFDKDNTIIDVDSMDETPDNTNDVDDNNSDETSNEDNNKNAQPPETNRQLSKKERRQKAREQREQQNKANANNNTEYSNDEKSKNESVSTDNVVPEGAIEE